MSLTDLSLVATIVEGFGSLGILAFTLYQVFCMRKELYHANIQTCFTIELELYEARRRFEDSAAAVLEWKSEYDTMTEQEKEKQKDRTKALALEQKSSKEAYLSELDRLCSYILRKRLNGKDFKEDWHSLIKELIAGYGEEINKKYEHISDLNKLWECEHIREFRRWLK